MLDLPHNVITVSPLVLGLLPDHPELKALILEAVAKVQALDVFDAKIILPIASNSLGSKYQIHTQTVEEDVKMAETATKPKQSAAMAILKKKSGNAETEEATMAEDQEQQVGEDTGEDQSSQDAVEADTPAAKTEGKAKGATITKTKKPAAAEGQVVQLASEIENMTESQALKTVHELIESQSQDEFRLGGILAKMMTENWIGEHESFRVMVEAEFGFKYRVALHLISIYNDLVAAEIPWVKVKRLGWTKLKFLAPVLSLDNVDDILKAVDGMNALQVEAYVAEYKKSGNAKAAAGSDDVSGLKSKTFKLFPGQRETVDLALEKAQTAGGTDSPNAALEYICLDYLSGNTSKPKPKTADSGDAETTKAFLEADDYIPLFSALRENKDTLEEALSTIFEAVSQVFPEAQVNVQLSEDE